MRATDILPIISIIFLISGSIIMLLGVVWLAKINSKYSKEPDISNTEYLITEMNQMFSYFSNKIEEKQERQNSSTVNYFDNMDSMQYEKVLSLSQKGKTAQEIAKELDMGKGEVNLILGIQQMR